MPAAIHVVPEAAKGGPLARIKTGDMITLDASAGRLTVDVSPSEFNKRLAEKLNPNQNLLGFGRDLFGLFRSGCTTAEQGGASFSGNIT